MFLVTCQYCVITLCASVAQELLSKYRDPFLRAPVPEKYIFMFTVGMYRMLPRTYGNQFHVRNKVNEKQL
jgi:hypothetical protein